VAGVVGADGTPGATGTTGPAGPTGPAGATGPAGTNGAAGGAGPAGATGPIGATGAAGANGTNGLSQYAYVYNLAGTTVAIEASVPFDTNGVMTPDITHAPGDTDVKLIDAGTYDVRFSVSGNEPSQFALFLDGAPVPGTVYGSGAGTQQNTGQVILTVAANDVISVRNHSSAAAVTLQTLAGGTQTNVNASLLIEKVG
jgi:hypothetical protein